MFNSVLTSLRSGTERLKDTWINEPQTKAQTRSQRSPVSLADKYLSSLVVDTRLKPNLQSHSHPHPKSLLPLSTVSLLHQGNNKYELINVHKPLNHSLNSEKRNKPNLKCRNNRSRGQRSKNSSLSLSRDRDLDDDYDESSSSRVRMLKSNGVRRSENENGETGDNDNECDKLLPLSQYENENENEEPQPQPTEISDEFHRRSDREEIRRRLALEADGGDLMDKPPRKHNLHSRLQSSMNLQICFMNETAASDSESPNSDTESHNHHQHQQPSSLPPLNKANKAQASVGQSQSQRDHAHAHEGPSISSMEDFFARQARLQAEARQALAQAKEMARLHLTQEREKRAHSPITEMVRNSLEKVGVSMPPDRRRVSRQLLTEMNVAQLQVIVNDLHSHIEKLNETLVSMLLERDDLHMEQDSMLVDIEDLTRYLAAKYNSPHHSLPLISASQSILGKK